MKSLRQPRRHPVTLRLLACWALLAWLSLAMPAATGQEASAAQRGSITRVQSDNFTFYGDMPQARASQLIADLEQFRFAMRDLYNVPQTRQDQHVRIYYITNAEVFAAQANTVNFAAF